MNAQEIYSEHDVTSFINVYFQEKEITKYDESKLRKLFDKYNITRKEYKLLNLNNSKRKNNQKLSLIKEELTNLKREYKNQKEEEIKKLCIEYDISILKYEEIKNTFQNDLKFHRSLKPTIDKFLKTKYNE